jgi:hypothetical protein
VKITISIEPEYKGMCSRCEGNATHAEWMAFDRLTYQVRDLTTYPLVEGVWFYVCDECCDGQSKHMCFHCGKAVHGPDVEKHNLHVSSLDALNCLRGRR